MGPGKVKVPDFYGLSKKDYYDILNNAGIKYEENLYETSDTLDGYVMWLSMEPGTEIDLEAGEVLKVFVASNPNGTTVTTSESDIPVISGDASEHLVTTVPPSVVTSPGDSRETDEPDIIITVDY